MLRALVLFLPGAASLSWRSGVDFGGSCARETDQTWNAIFRPQGDVSLRLESYPVFAALSADRIVAGPEQTTRWKLNASYGYLSTGDVCIDGTGASKPCGLAPLNVSWSFSSGGISFPWLSALQYNAAGGATNAQTMVISNSTVTGEWAEASLASPSTVARYSLTPTTYSRRFPRSHILAGSADDGATWFTLGQVTTSAPNSIIGMQPASFRTSYRGKVTKVRLVVTSISPNSGGYANLASVTLQTDTGGVWLEQPTRSIATATDAYVAPTALTVATQATGFSSFEGALSEFSSGASPTVAVVSSSWSAGPPAGSLSLVSFRVAQGVPSTPVSGNLFLWDATSDSETTAIVGGRSYRALVWGATTGIFNNLSKIQAAVIKPVTATPQGPTVSPTQPPTAAPCDSPLVSITA